MGREGVDFKGFRGLWNPVRRLVETDIGQRGAVTDRYNLT